MKYNYRITKYDPQYRNENGNYGRDEWTAISDVGSAFEGVILTLEDYEKTEKAYVDTVLRFMEEGKTGPLKIKSFENHRHASLPTFIYPEAIISPPAHLEHLVKMVLREEIWCKLENILMRVHFGYDYYMYISVHAECKEAITKAQESGLFVEEYLSPYNAEND